MPLAKVIGGEVETVTEASLDLDPESVAPAGRRRVPEWLVVLGIGVFSAVLFAIPYWQHWDFYLVGDAPESFVPNWHHYGELIRAGHWPIMEANGWYGGNYAAEAATSVWNPLSALNFVIVSYYDNLAAASAFVAVQYLALIAMGVYLLAREYGAGRVPAALVGIGVPAAGFTLYYDAAGWPSGLLAFMWFIWFWWATRRFSRGELWPVVPFLIGVGTMLTGHPYVPLAIIFVLLAVGVELLLGKDMRRLVHLVVMGACVGVSAVLALGPLLGAISVSTRQDWAGIGNSAFLVPDLGDLAASSAPTYLPSIVNWSGLFENVPSTYFIWFALPLLPWLRWRSLRHPARPMISLAIVTAIYAVLVLGPSNVWLFRWPIRLIPFLYLGLGVLLAVLMSAGLARDRVRERVLATIALVAAGGYLSFAVRPEYYRLHLAAAAAVLVFTLGAVLAYRRRGWRAAGAVLLIGSIGVLTFQTMRLPTRGPEVPGAAQQPHVVSRIQAGTTNYRGTILQLASQQFIRNEDSEDGQILFGSMAAARGKESITRYSGIEFNKFVTALCLNYKGVACGESFDRAWQTAPGTDVPFIDLMRVETLVLQDKLFPDLVGRTPPAGWSVLLRDGARTVWVRDLPPPYPGRVSWASGGTTVLTSAAETDHEQVRFRAPDGGGKLIFARLDWPGYTATVDGRPIAVQNGFAGLITVDLPPGEHTLELSYQEPGVRLGFWVLIGAAAVSLAQTGWLLAAARRGRRRAEPTVVHDEDTGHDDTITPPVMTHTGSN